MADSVITEPNGAAVTLAGWQNIISKLTKQSKGLAALSFDSYADGATAPSVVAGGIYEINGTYYEVDSDTLITGMSTVSTAYYIYSTSGTWSSSTTAPAWDEARNGWYLATDANARCFFRLETDSGGEYDNRTNIDYGELARFTATFTSSGSFTVPSGYDYIDIIACGGGSGGGGFNTASVGGVGAATTLTSGTGSLSVNTFSVSGGRGSTYGSNLSGFGGGTTSTVTSILAATDGDYAAIGRFGENGGFGKGGQGGSSYFGGGRGALRQTGVANGGYDAVTFGAGGGGGQGTTAALSGGGGGGGNTIFYRYKCTPGEVLTITVGTGGAGSGDGGDGADGIVIIKY